MAGAPEAGSTVNRHRSEPAWLSVAGSLLPSGEKGGRRRGSGACRQRRGDPFSCKEKGRDEVSAPRPAKRRANRAQRAGLSLMRITADPSPCPLPTGEGSPRSMPACDACRENLSPRANPALFSPRSARPRGLSRGIVRPGGVAVFMASGRCGPASWRRRSSSGPNRQARVLAGLPMTTGPQRTARGARRRLTALLRHLDFDIDFGTQPSTATPPLPAHPLGFAVV